MHITDKSVGSNMYSLPDGVEYIPLGSPHFGAFVSDARAPNYCPYLPSADYEKTKHNRALLALKLGIYDIACVRQVHGKELAFYSCLPDSISLQRADAIATSMPNRAVSVFVADCVPILLYGKAGVVAIHAGRRGLMQRIVKHVCQQLISCIEGMNTQEMSRWGAWIGPCICPRCYQIDSMTAKLCLDSGFADSNVYPYRGTPEGMLAKNHQVRQSVQQDTATWFCDLRQESCVQLAQCGITRISHMHECVRCNPRWPSYRRGDSARMMCGIWKRA